MGHLPRSRWGGEAIGCGAAISASGGNSAECTGTRAVPGATTVMASAGSGVVGGEERGSDATVSGAALLPERVGNGE